MGHCTSLWASVLWRLFFIINSINQIIALSFKISLLIFNTKRWAAEFHQISRSFSDWQFRDTTPAGNVPFVFRTKKPMNRRLGMGI